MHHPEQLYTTARSIRFHVGPVLILLSGLLLGADLMLAAATSSPPASRPGADARQQFIDVETIARLPAQRQVEELPRLYREASAGLMNQTMIEGIVSSFPAELLARDRKYRMPGDTVPYRQQLSIAAKTMTPQQVADAIIEAHGTIILKVAARQRCLQVFTSQGEALARLIDEDLKSKDPNTVNRACLVISSLRLMQYSDALLKLYLADGPLSQATGSTLAQLQPPGAAARVIAAIESDPPSLKRHAMLLRSLLQDQLSDPVLIGHLDDKDPTMSLAAARSLAGCRDAALAPHIRELVLRDNPEVRWLALEMSFNLPDDAFTGIRVDLLACLEDKDPSVRIEAISGFAARKDIAAAKPLLQFLRAEKAPENDWRLTQAMNNLTGDTFRYNPREWGPGNEANRRAIASFENWIAAQHQP